jgi:major vault protein
MADERRERDLILAPNEYAYILDETKGNIVNYVGPHKTSLANTDQPVVFNETTKRFERCNLERAIQLFAIAPEGWYVVQKNPAQDGKAPTPGTANSLPSLDIGHKINIPGPVSFAPWPGQMVRVLQGHRLRSNQYLVVRVYDEEAARKNWGKAVIKPQTTDSEPQVIVANVPELTVGKLLIIKGTEVSFYIPPTGVEVVPDSNNGYVRDAVTLERLEYCILLDEEGNKRYIIGPSVVFPEPTETFIKKDGAIKFRAIELNEISGIYIKVIAPYEENGKSYQVGDELFITGKEQMIYFPRPEHAIVRYSDQEINYAVAIPAGEARYVLNRLTGQITLQRGPCMFLPDPRKQVIARRVLDPKLVAIWFPGNKEALEYNTRLMALNQKKQLSGDFVAEQQARSLLQAGALPDVAPAPAVIASEEFNRKQDFTKPRTVTLDTKYEGAVSIDVWTGYAVMVVSKNGERKVIVGPQTYLLEYDETLQTIYLSTGTPKTDEQPIKTVYLRSLHNKVSDLIEVETADFCPVQLLLSYQMNFTGEPDKWFDIENYVKFLTEHIRSILRYAIKKYGIEAFYANAIGIVRDTLLGTANEAGVRAGLLFSENGMHVYDVEVLDVTIQDAAISQLLIKAQHSVVQQTLEIASEKRQLELKQQQEAIKQQILQAGAQTQQLQLDLEIAAVNKQLAVNLAKINNEIGIEKQRLDADLAKQQQLDSINNAELSRQKAQSDLDLAVSNAQLQQQIAELQADVEATVQQAQAVSPQFIAAMQAFADKALAEKLAQSMSPLAILGGNSVADVFSQLVKGTILEKVLTEQQAIVNQENLP